MSQRRIKQPFHILKVKPYFTDDFCIKIALLVIHKYMVRIIITPCKSVSPAGVFFGLLRGLHFLWMHSTGKAYSILYCQCNSHTIVTSIKTAAVSAALTENSLP